MGKMGLDTRVTTTNRETGQGEPTTIRDRVGKQTGVGHCAKHRGGGLSVSLGREDSVAHPSKEGFEGLHWVLHWALHWLLHEVLHSVFPVPIPFPPHSHGFGCSPELWAQGLQLLPGLAGRPGNAGRAPLPLPSKPPRD